MIASEGQSRIRVLRVIARMNVGGPALQVVGLTEGLDERRFDQRLLVGDVGQDEGDYIKLRAPHLIPVRVPGLGRDANIHRDVQALGRVFREVRAFRPHIVHTHTAKAGVIGRVAAVAARAPLRVHTFHGHLLHGYFSPKTTRLIVATERALARGTTRLVAVGERVRDELLEAGIGRAEQYVVVPPGIEPAPAPARRQARAQLSLAPRVPVVAFVGRITAVKRPDRFVEAAELVAARHPETIFLVVGDGGLVGAMKDRASRGKARLMFLGWREDVETIFAAADVAMLTSDNEGMPLSLIEAAWAGCPAVTTDVGSASEVVANGSTGFVVGPSPKLLADAVLRLIAEPDLRRSMGAAATSHARSRFGRQRLVEDTTELYERLVRGAEARCSPW